MKALLKSKTIAHVIALLIALTMIVNLTGCASAPGGEAKSYVADPLSTTYDEDLEAFYADHFEEWYKEYEKNVKGSKKYTTGFKHYYETILPAILNADKKHNTVFSPINIFIALAMLSVCTDGETRAQIDKVLGVKDHKDLAKMVQAVMKANASSNPVLTSELANSFWLNQNFEYNENTLKELVSQYFASSYIGDMKDKAMTQQFQEWIDEHTGHLLSEAVKGLQLDPDTLIAIASTLYYKAIWEEDFSEPFDDTFHGLDKDQKVKMMTQLQKMPYFDTPKMTGIALGLNRSGSMYVFKPKKGVDVADLINSDELVKALSQEGSERRVKATIPTFDFTSEIDLKSAMVAMGMTDVFGDADFSPLTKEKAVLSEAKHAARLTVDEKGVTGAAFTVFNVKSSAVLDPNQPIEFKADEPFVYVVTGADGAILFAGTIYNL